MTVSSSPIRVAVIYGGMSSEHSVSCVTASSIMSNLDRNRYEVLPIGITRDGTWTVGTVDPEELSMGADGRCEVRLRDEVRLSVTPHRVGQVHYVSGDKAGELYGKVDVIVPALHGDNGEDGTIQGLFELSGVAYVGCGVLCSAVCMDKEFTKKLLSAAGLAVAPGAILHTGDTLSDDEKQHLGLPVYVKPARGGSSIGVSKVTDWAELDHAVELARTEDSKVLVEPEIVGPEVEIGVLQQPDGSLVASVPAQLVGTTDSDEGFYGFETKYLASTVHAVIPAPLDADTTATMRRMAVEAFRAIDGRGLARVDFFATANGPVINEINTLPGFTPISMYPQVFAASGVSYPELLDTLIETALSS